MSRRLLAMVVAAGLSATGVQASTLSDIYSGFFVFGDSLSDKGNLGPVNGPPAPYFGNRFSNGRVWAEHFADQFAPGTTQNYAYGGAEANPPSRTPPLAQQLDFFQADLAGLDLIPNPVDPTQPPVELFSGTPTPGARPLASVWIGSNDILRVFNTIRDIQNDTTKTPSEKAAEIAAVSAAAPGEMVTAATNVVNSLSQLNSLGFADFLVFNLPDIGSTPLFAGTAAESQANALASLFNTTLKAGLSGLSVGNITQIDFRALLRGALDGTGPITRAVTDRKCFVPPVFNSSGVPIAPPQICADPENYLFWDDVHPTGSGHRDLAAFVEAQLTPVPAGPALPLLATALVGFALIRRRR